MGWHFLQSNPGISGLASLEVRQRVRICRRMSAARSIFYISGGLAILRHGIFTERITNPIREVSTVLPSALLGGLAFVAGEMLLETVWQMLRRQRIDSVFNEYRLGRR